MQVDKDAESWRRYHFATLSQNLLGNAYDPVAKRNKIAMWLLS